MKKDTYSYKGWLISDSFFKRLLAIYGYMGLASIIMTIPIAIIITIIENILE